MRAAARLKSIAPGPKHIAYAWSFNLARHGPIAKMAFRPKLVQFGTKIIRQFQSSIAVANSYVLAKTRRIGVGEVIPPRAGQDALLNILFGRPFTPILPLVTGRTVDARREMRAWLWDFRRHPRSRSLARPKDRKCPRTTPRVEEGHARRQLRCSAQEVIFCSASRTRPRSASNSAS